MCLPCASLEKSMDDKSAKSSILISVQALSKYYGRLHVIDDLSFDVASGEFLAVVGPSGCGKTTLLKIIGGVLEPTSGKVTLRNSEASTARRKGEFGFVFQNPVLLPWRTLYENVHLPLEVLGNTSARDIPSLLQMVGLKGFEDALPKQLSGGMQQRVALARALVFNPSVLLMDEPFGAVDELNRERLNYELMTIWSKLQTTVIFVTHSIPEAVLMSERVVVLTDRPAKIAAIIPINLPRPRNQEVRTSVEYISTVEKVRTCLAKL